MGSKKKATFKKAEPKQNKVVLKKSLKTKEQLEKENFERLKALEEFFIATAMACLKEITKLGPYKACVIIQDAEGNGVSRSTPDFTDFEFEQWSATIKKLKTTNL